MHLQSPLTLDVFFFEKITPVEYSENIHKKKGNLLLHTWLRMMYRWKLNTFLIFGKTVTVDLRPRAATRSNYSVKTNLNNRRSTHHRYWHQVLEEHFFSPCSGRLVISNWRKNIKNQKSVNVRTWLAQRVTWSLHGMINLWLDVT